MCKSADKGRNRNISHFKESAVAAESGARDDFVATTL